MDREQIRKRLEEIKFRLEVASPGPWEWVWYYLPGEAAEDNQAARLVDANGLDVLAGDFTRDGREPYIAGTSADYEFIAKAYKDLEWLCSVVEELLQNSKPRGGGEGGEGT